MNELGSVIARRLAFLEHELDRMGGGADDAEHELRLNPTDPAASRRLEAIYALAGKTWAEILELRARHPDPSVIHYDHNADALADRTYRRALG
jgi:hypothetical protein